MHRSHRVDAKRQQELAEAWHRINVADTRANAIAEARAGNEAAAAWLAVVAPDLDWQNDNPIARDLAVAGQQDWYLEAIAEHAMGID